MNFSTYPWNIQITVIPGSIYSCTPSHETFLEIKWFSSKLSYVWGLIEKGKDMNKKFTCIVGLVKREVLEKSLEEEKCNLFYTKEY